MDEDVPVPFRARRSGNTLNINAGGGAPASPPVNVTFNQTISAAYGSDKAMKIDAAPHEGLAQASDAAELVTVAPALAQIPAPAESDPAAAPHVDHDRILAELLDRVFNLEQRVGELERLPDAVAFLPPEEEPLPEPPPHLDEPPAAVDLPPAVGDWRAAIAAMDEDPAEEDFGIGMEIEPDPQPDPEPVPVVEAAVPDPTPPEPAAPPSPSKTLVFAEQRTVKDDWWGKRQILYETALMAKNGSIYAKGLLMEPASRRGVGVTELADEILKERDELVQQVMSEL